MIPVVLSIAGSDSSGGAGIQADIKSIQANGGYAATVITAITAQNTVGVSESMNLPVPTIEAQFEAVVSDLTIQATKTGMLSTAEIVESVSWKIEEHDVGPVVVDPVMISKSGHPLLEQDAVKVLVRELFPQASLVTPNAHEAGYLVDTVVKTLQQAREVARAIHAMGPEFVLVKGGHIDEPGEAVDLLFDGTAFFEFRKPRVETFNTHGTGCTYASAIATNLAKGMNMFESVKAAKIYVTGAIQHGLAIGAGNGPTDHFWEMRHHD